MKHTDNYVNYVIQKNGQYNSILSIPPNLDKKAIKTFVLNKVDISKNKIIKVIILTDVLVNIITKN